MRYSRARARSIALALGVLVAVISAAPALGARSSATDPDDAGGFLDIATIAYHGTRHSTGTLTIKTYEGFSCNYLKPGRDAYLKWLFDDGKDGDFELVGKFVCRSNKLYMDLRGKKSGNNYEPIKAKRKNARTTKVTFPFDLPEMKSRHLGLVAKSKDGVNAACDPVCLDRAPDSGEMPAY
ncbi:MAG: hypothetical protein M3290_08600 [Actinomycetota bacterium]|nr:hypothetical protein [Actinomycetota bacterium]